VHSHLTAVDPPSTASPDQLPGTQRPLRSIARHPFTVHLVVFLGFLGAGIAVTWPHATYLTGRLPYTRDAGSYVWGFWWMAHAVLHLQDPWLTTYIAAPVGTQLGLHALMPLAGAVMLPVTVVFGPSASYTLLSVLLPGLMGYAMYRVARLWLPSQVGAIAAGAFFGFSGLLSYQTWVHLNLAAGALFLPITLEAAIRLRRKSSPGRAVVLGLVLGATMLTDQESAVLALIIAILALLPWLFPYLAPAKSAVQSAPKAASELPVDEDDDTQPIPRLNQAPYAKALRRLSRIVRSLARSFTRSLAPALLRTVRRVRIRWLRVLLLALAGAVALIVAGPQLIAIMHATAAGSPPASLSAPDYLEGIRLPDMFLPSPRVTYFGLAIRHARDPGTFGAVPSVLALIGLALGWRRRNAWLLALFWLGAAALAVGSDILVPGGTITPLPETFNGIQVSSVLPFTWFAQIPGLSGFREPSRVAELGFVPVALLAGYTVNWIRYHVRLLVIPVLALSVFELGLTTPSSAVKTMATNYPAIDRLIAADHSGSVVLDVPFGLRGGTGVTGLPFVAQSQVIATADGHPLADALLSRVPTSTINAINSEPFYHDLISAQSGRYQFSTAQIQQAAENAARMHIGWVMLWTYNKHLRAFLVETGFSFLYRADGASLWRPDGFDNGVTTPPP
jgi:hypothetical protein